MIRALIDTNIVRDALASREPFRVHAEKIFLLAAEEKLQGYITASSVTDIYYLVRKNSSDRSAREALRNLFQIFMLIDVSGKNCELALDMPVEGYEDALILTCAARIKTGCLVTRDESFLKIFFPVIIVSPDQLLKIFFGKNEIL